jgi:D-alanine-D-alanine ligase-like ATP-grasp enzyme
MYAYCTSCNVAYDAPMLPKKYSPIIAKLFKKIAPKIGATVYVEPNWGIVGQITFKSGRKSYFRYNTIDINALGASEISKDKDYANYFLKRAGYKTVPGEAFYSDDWCATIGSKRNIHAAYRYAKKLGFPLVVKPNSGSQGKEVHVVSSKSDFYKSMKAIFKIDRIALVQRKVEGRDYRVVVLDKEVISAYERIPLNVVGDGRSTILQLLKKKQRGFVASSRDTRLKINDPRIAAKLKRQKLLMRSVAARGSQVFLLDNANLSSGGDAVDVTNDIHSAFKKIAIGITRDMGLRLCGVDLMVEGVIRKRPKTYWILETNAAPGLDHYVQTGKAQEEIVEDLYLKVLKSMER